MRPCTLLALASCLALSACIRNESIAAGDGGSDAASHPDTMVPGDTMVATDSGLACGEGHTPNMNPGTCAAVDYGVESGCRCVIGWGWDGTRCTTIGGCRVTRNADRLYPNLGTCEAAFINAGCLTPPDAAGSDASGDAGAVCRTTADCPTGQRCAYDPGSCNPGVTGHCIDRGCESLPVAPQYCGCNGLTFGEPSACPPDHPYSNTGACPTGGDGGSCWDGWAMPLTLVAASSRPAPASSPALRLEFTYGPVGTRGQISLDRVNSSVVVRPSDGPFTPGVNSGSWVELRDASDHTLYTRGVFELVPETIEGPGPDGGLVRSATCPGTGFITVDNVPNNAAATQVVFFSDPLDGLPGGVASELARFTLPAL